MKTYTWKQKRARMVFVWAIVLMIGAILGISFGFSGGYTFEKIFLIIVVFTFAITGFLAYYAWEQRDFNGAIPFMLFELSQSLLALAEGISILSKTQSQALFWFDVRFIPIACGPIFLLIFALDYTGRKDWRSKGLIIIMFIIPFITQIMLWTNNLHGLWVRQEVGFRQVGPFWIAETSSRIPGVWFMAHSIFTTLIGVLAVILILLAAWRQERRYRLQMLLLASGTLIPQVIALIPTFNLNPAAQYNPLILGIAPGAILIGTAAYRFWLFADVPLTGPGARSGPLDPQSLRSLILFLFVFILLVIGLGVIGYISYQNYETQFRSQVGKQLSVIAELKVSQLEYWRKERMADAATMYRNPAFSALVKRAIGNPADIQASVQLQSWLETIQSHYEYDRVFLLDAQNVERISSPNSPEQTEEHLRQDVAKVFKSKKVTFLDFHHDSGNGPIYLAILVPILEEGTDMPVGVVVLRIDPNKYLYPFIGEWPIPSNSAETLLVRRDGNDVLFLNELKFSRDSALTLRIPLQKTDSPIVMAVLGQSGIMEGLDYRDVSVLAVAQSVPESPWILVSKMDSTEVFAPLNTRAWELALLFGALMISAGAGSGQLWRQQRLRFYREQVETTESLRRSEERYRGLVEHASDGIFIADPTGKYIEVNSSGCAMLGYKR